MQRKHTRYVVVRGKAYPKTSPKHSVSHREGLSSRNRSKHYDQVYGKRLKKKTVFKEDSKGQLSKYEVYEGNKSQRVRQHYRDFRERGDRYGQRGDAIRSGIYGNLALKRRNR